MNPAPVTSSDSNNNNTRITNWDDVQRMIMQVEQELIEELNQFGEQMDEMLAKTSNIAFPVTNEYLRHSNRDIRKKALQRLQQRNTTYYTAPPLDPTTTAALEPFQSTLAEQYVREPYDDLRGLIISATSAMSHLLQYLQHESNPTLRESIAHQLTRLPPDPSNFTYINSFLILLDDSHAPVRCKALDKLHALLPSSNPPQPVTDITTAALQAVIPHLHDTDPQIRTRAYDYLLRVMEYSPEYNSTCVDLVFRNLYEGLNYADLLFTARLFQRCNMDVSEVLHLLRKSSSNSSSSNRNSGDNDGSNTSVFTLSYDSDVNASAEFAATSTALEHPELFANISPHK